MMSPVNISPPLAGNVDAAVQKSLFPAKAGSGKVMDPQKIEAASKDFEALFISQMVEQMFGESGGESAFGTGETDEVYKNLMVQEYGKMITQSGGIGIADYVKRELLKQQEM